MSVEANDILGGMAIGIGATLVMAVWNLFLKRTFGTPSLNYCLLGRWLRHMPGGTFRHASISAASRKPFECTIGRIAHYAIGVVFALVFVVLASDDWLARPTLLPALLYGVGTVVFPFFIMQPSFGLGVAASRTPKPTQARLKSLATHAVFGVGLYACALGVSYVLRVAAQARLVEFSIESSGDTQHDVGYLLPIARGFRNDLPKDTCRRPENQVGSLAF